MSDNIAQLQMRIFELETAIKNHRDKHHPDFEDHLELYSVLNDEDSELRDTVRSPTNNNSSSCGMSQ